MRAEGFWLTGIAALMAATAGWAFVRRDQVICWGAIAATLLFSFVAFTSFIENCGGGGDCETYANWPEPKAVAVAGIPPLVVGLVAAIAGAIFRKSRASRSGTGPHR